MSAIKDQWCSCTRLREAEEKAAKWDAIVLCRDCRHYDGEECLRLYGAYPTATDFCSRGERRQQ